MYTELAFFGSKNECARTDAVFLSVSEVCDGTVSLKWQTAPVLSASTQPKQDTKKITSQIERELHPP